MLSRALANLASQDWPEGWSVLVVDNSIQQSAKPIFQRFLSRLPDGSRYVLETSKGFSTVRNRAVSECVDHDAICFMDDDQVATSTWLAAMTAAWSGEADTIVHSITARVPNVPNSQSGIDAIAAEIIQRGHGSPAGAAGLLLPTPLATRFPFDSHYDTSGGEDTDLLMRLASTGCGRLVPSTVLLMEEDRSLRMPPLQTLRMATRSGQLYVHILKRNGRPIVVQRTKSALGIPVALGQALLATAADPHAGRRHMRRAATRLGVALGPSRRDTGEVGARPTSPHGHEPS